MRVEVAGERGLVRGVQIARRVVWLCAFLLAVAGGLSSCGGAEPRSSLGSRPASASHTPTPQPATAEEAIRQLVLLEGQGVVGQDTNGLMGLWAADAVIRDAKHTLDNANDDARWQGRDAIRERYVTLVFPGNPGLNNPTDISITITGDTAEATSTTHIGGEISPGGDRWTFVKREGRWWISGLTYNLEPK